MTLSSRLKTTVTASATVLSLTALLYSPASTFAEDMHMAPSASQVIDQFQVNAGLHPTQRRNHTKGICAVGYFDSSGELAHYTSAQTFAHGVRTPVVGRFSIPGGNPEGSDANVPVRGLALSFSQPDGQQWRTAMLNAPVFSAPTPTLFFGELQAKQPDPASGKPDADALAAAIEANPKGSTFRDWAKATTPSTSYATQHYNSLVAFVLTDGDGKHQPVRWQLVPGRDNGTGKNQTVAADGLEDDLQDRLSKGTLDWHFVVILGQPEDPTDDATQAWPDDRERIDAGTLTLQATAAPDTGACRDIAFDPLMLPRGIEGSDDPLLSFRSDAYKESLKRRLDEQAE